MRVTVAINTWNRCQLLDATLEQMRKLEIPREVSLGLIIVDNNSTDGTKQVVDKYSAHLPIDYVFEPRQGTSFAKNSALERAHGELTLWTDDDVLVEADWLRAYLKAAEDFPDATIFGGTIRPWLPEPNRCLPRWAERNIAVVGQAWALRDYGPKVRPLGDSEQIFGANMAFRTAPMKAYRFNTTIGDVGGKIRKGEDAEFIHRMLEDGHKAVWVGNASVRHYLPPQRVTKRYVWNLTADVHEAGYNPQEDAKVPHIGKVPRYLLRRYISARLNSFAFSPWKNQRWAESFMLAARTRGQIRAAARAGTPAADAKA